MKAKKYVSGNETPKGFECTKQKCKWQGVGEDKAIQKEDDWNLLVCPNCGNPEFYGLKEKPIKKEYEYEFQKYKKLSEYIEEMACDGKAPREWTSFLFELNKALKNKK